MTVAFRLNNQETKRELKVYNSNKILTVFPTPIYVGVKLDRSLTFRHHLVALPKKLFSRVTQLRRLVVQDYPGFVLSYQNQLQAFWIELTRNSLGQAQMPADWCWAIPLVHAQPSRRIHSIYL